LVINESIYNLFLCIVGLEPNEFVEIRMSNIDKRFYGCFAKENISKNVVIGQYKGKLIGENDSLSNYKHLLSENEIIDASDFLSCHGRYINDCLVSNENVRMKVNYKKKSIDIITTKVIENNEEILTDYGPDYWDGKAAAMHLHDPTKEFSLVVAENKKRKRDHIESDMC